MSQLHLQPAGTPAEALEAIAHLAQRLGRRCEADQPFGLIEAQAIVEWLQVLWDARQAA